MSTSNLATVYLVGAVRVFLRDADGALMRVECASTRQCACALYRAAYLADAVRTAQARHASRSPELAD